MSLVRVWLVLAAAIGTALAQTNAPEVRRLSLADALQSALEKNLALRIARYNPPLAQTDLQAAYAGYEPTFNIAGLHSFDMSGGGVFNPTTGTIMLPSTTDANSFSSSLKNGLTPWGLNYSLQGNIVESYGRTDGNPFDNSRAQASLTLAQPLLKNFWIDQIRFTIRVAKNRLKYSELGLKLKVMQTATQVEQAYYDLIYSRQNVAVQQNAVELARQLVAQNQKRLDVGALAKLDVKQAESQAATAEADLIRAQQALGTQLETVKALISDDFAAWAGVDLVPTDELLTERRFFDLQNSWGRALTQRPDLLQAKLDVERQGITLKYTYNQLFPELDLVGSYGHNAGGFGIREFSDAFNQLGEGNRPTYSYGALLSFPIGDTGARANYRRSKLVMEQYVLTLKQLEQTIMIKVHNDVGSIRGDYDSVMATRKAREFAEAALDAEQKRLQSGKSTTYTVLQMQRDLTTARGNEIQALVFYNKDLSQLSFDEGSTLDRLKIKLEVK